MKQTYKEIEANGRKIILVGTAHVSRESMEEVAEVIRAEQPDRVCVELDEGRLQALNNEKGWQELDISRVLRDGKGFLLLANLVLSTFQKKMGADTGVKPGDEMKEAIKVATELSIPQTMVDRPIQVTLQRAWAKNGLWGKSKLLGTLISSAFSNEEISEEDIENLKNQGAMDAMMSELSAFLPTVKEVLIDERDRYLAAHIWKSEGQKIVAILGAGHLPGTEAALRAIASGETDTDTSSIDSAPPKTLGSKIAGFIIPALIVGLLVAGFFTGGAAASIDMLVRWLLWNGSLAAVGTILALGHPLSVITAFVAAPAATINPFVGVGLRPYASLGSKTQSS